jgi:hypothetical protein
MELIDSPDSAASDCGVVESRALILPFSCFGSCWSSPPSFEARELREEFVDADHAEAIEDLEVDDSE